MCSQPTANQSRTCDRCQAEAGAREARRRQEERARQEREAEETRRRAAEEEARRRRQEEEARRNNVRTIADLQRLSGEGFEKYVASLFEKDGYRVTQQGGSGDEGVDLIIHIGGAKDAVQCKRWKNDIGSAVVREFYGSIMHIGARHGFILTTASFSDSAKSFANGKPITLIDGAYLLAWINGAKSSRSSAGQSSAGAKRGTGNGFDPYQVLGVSRNASQAEIRAAFIALVAKYHPDKVSHLGKEFQQMAHEKMLAINRAYDELRTGS